MNGPDFRQQQELEEERMALSLEALHRVDRGLATHDDVLFLASELGLVSEFIRSIDDECELKDASVK